MTFLHSTPFSFLFGLVYSSLFLLLFFFSSFFVYWVVMELLMLALMGVAYSMVVSCYASLMSYFLLQTYSSFSIFCFFILQWDFGFFLAVLFKLSMFPFHFWFPAVCYRLPNVLLWVVATVHKFPLYLALYTCSLPVNSVMLLVSVVFTMGIIGVSMLFLAEFRLFIIFSTSFNGAWLMLAYSAGAGVFLSYFFMYSLALGAILVPLSLRARPSFSEVTKHYSQAVYVFISMLVLSGLPPSPLFFIKCGVVWLALLSGVPAWFLLVALWLTVTVVASYFIFTFNYMVYNYASHF